MHAVCYAVHFVNNIKFEGVFFRLETESKTATVIMGCTESIGPDSEPVKVENYKGDIVIPEIVLYEGTEYTVSSIEGHWVSGLGRLNSYGAFEDCDELTSITIPKTINSISGGAFKGCAALKAVYISDLEAWLKIGYGAMGPRDDLSYGNPLELAHNLYLNGVLVSDLVIPDNITKINSLAFVGSNISSIVFHKNVTSIGSGAFKACDNLRDVYTYSPCISAHTSFENFENKTLHIRKRYYEDYYNGFVEKYNEPGEKLYDWDWKSFGKIEFIEGIDYHLIYLINGEEYKKIWKESGEAIIAEPYPQKEGYTFSGWSEIPANMPDHDVTITGSFSQNIYKLTYMVGGNVYKVYELKYDESITPEADPAQKGKVFSGWSEIPQKMPANDVTVTGTFSWSKLAKNGVEYQVYDAEKELAKIVGNNKTSGDVFIESPVEIDGYNYSVTTISDKVFSGCSGITKITIPATITKVGERTFANIDKLTDVTILAKDIPETDRTAFENSYIEDYVTLHVPDGSVEKYKAVAPWKNFKDVVAIEGTKVIPVPEIVMEKGEVTFICEEEDVEFHYEVTPLGQEAGKGNKVILGQSYRINVYASKDGYQDSETVTKEFTIKKGDLNLDGKVDVADHVELSSIIMTAKTEEGSSQEDHQE